MTFDELKSAIEKRVREYGHVTFAEIVEFIDGTKGDQALHHSAFENIVLWDGLSNDAATAIQQLLEERKIHIHPATTFTYMIDGRGLTYPVAKTARSYAKPHWLPICFHHAPFKAPAEPKPTAKKRSATKR